MLSYIKIKLEMAKLDVTVYSSSWLNHRWLGWVRDRERVYQRWSVMRRKTVHSSLSTFFTLSLSLFLSQVHTLHAVMPTSKVLLVDSQYEFFNPT